MRDNYQNYVDRVSNKFKNIYSEIAIIDQLFINIR